MRTLDLRSSLGACATEGGSQRSAAARRSKAQQVPHSSRPFGTLLQRGSSAARRDANRVLWRRRLALALCGLAPALAGCGQRESEIITESSGNPVGLPNHQAPVLRATSNAGSFVAEIRPLDGPIPMNEHFSVELALFAPDGVTPFAPEEVTLDGRMEAHEHGMLVDVGLVPVRPGVWRADGVLFHMFGDWQFQVDVRQGARVERAQMDHLLQ
jgi:hypothetical protein